MFDIGFSELVLIAVVALVVIGPERLPKVARTAGHLFARFNRYVSQVKADISREMELEELRKTGQEFKESVEDVGKNVEEHARETDYVIREEIGQAEKTVAGALGHDAAGHPSEALSSPPPAEPLTTNKPAQPLHE